jgi:hypothetical protein
LRHKTIAHFDAKALKFHDDAKGYAHSQAMMNPSYREELGDVIRLMKEYLSIFKISDN